MMHGQVVAITGASRGIGMAAAAAFVAKGASVALLARDTSRLESLAESLGPNAIALACDVSESGSLTAALAETRRHFGRLDVMINNAGVIDPIARIETADPALWGRAIDINLKGVFHGMQAALPILRAQGSGTVITLSSGAAHRPLEGWSAYCAAKAGAAMLTRALHEEEGHWLRVLSLSPGTVATDMQRVIRASGMNAVSQIDWAEHIPADWPARALIWMCSPAADRWRGQEISLRDTAIRRELGLA